MNYFHQAKVHFIASHQHPINQILHLITHLFAIAAVVFLFYDWRLTLLFLLLIQVLPSAGMPFLKKTNSLI